MKVFTTPLLLLLLNHSDGKGFSFIVSMLRIPCCLINHITSDKLKIDIIAGTSIGGPNASLIAGSRNEKDYPEKALEQFWLELAEGSH